MDSGYGPQKQQDDLTAEDIAEVRKWMGHAVEDIPGYFGSILRTQVENTGKLLRPRCFMAAWRMFSSSGNPGAASRSDAARMAASLELLHLATLVHDDILDNAGLRRGRPTVFALEGARKAVLSGDLLLTSSLSLCADLIPAEDYPLFSRALRSLCMGEVLQMKTQDPEKPSMRLYLRQIGAKTAVMFALALRYGARAGGASSREVLVMQRAGFQAGMGFQVIDDLKDMVFRGEGKDKTPGRDLESGLLTAPVLCALKARDSDRFRKMLTKNLGRKNTPQSIKDRISRECAGLGGIEGARLMARRHLDRSLACISTFPPRPGREELLGILHSLDSGHV